MKRLLLEALQAVLTVVGVVALGCAYYVVIARADDGEPYCTDCVVDVPTTDDACRLWIEDGRWETDCDTSAQAARIFDYFQPMIDEYVRERCGK